jgi:hypothetical protein
MPFPIPSQSEKVTTNPPVMTQAWYAFLYNLWKPLRNLWSVDDGKVLFMDGDAVNGATVGPGLTLNRTTNTLSADGSAFPEAPMDGRQYGRQMADWTVVQVTAASIGAVPGLPAASIQYNSTPTPGTFTGNAEYTIDPVNSVLYLGAVASWTIQPKDAAAGVGGNNLTILAGKGGSAGAPAGDLILSTLAGGNNPTTGDVDISTGDFSGGNSTGAIVVHTGDNAGAGASGIVSFLSGNAPSGSTGSYTAGSGDGSSSGFVLLKSGGGAATITGLSGDVALGSGDAGFTTGNVELVTGNTTIASASSGEINILTGNSVGGTADSGDINLITGTATDERGSVNIEGNTVNVIANSFTINGSPVGGGAPYFVPSGSTVTIPEYFQALFVLPIDVEGTLEVSGYLIEMTQ